MYVCIYVCIYIDDAAAGVYLPGCMETIPDPQSKGKVSLCVRMEKLFLDWSILNVCLLISHQYLPLPEHLIILMVS